MHPGYGFLSERAAFARACEEAGLVFVGPPADVIERMGSKIAARALMQSAGVPVVPGSTPADQIGRWVLAAARTIGYPVLVKASAGGGGKGMRLVRSDAEARELVLGGKARVGSRHSATAPSTSNASIERPRHVEVQVFADAHGHASTSSNGSARLQRRHQKIVEESPSPALTPALRDKMGAPLLPRRGHRGYRNAGTVEFLLEGSGNNAKFYFLEMNTRLQVEHPVTEAVTGVDLVQAQLLWLPAGRCRGNNGRCRPRGHAIECRIYAEDPDHGFPSAGRLPAALSRAGRARAFASTRASKRAARSPSTTTRCSQSLSRRPRLALLVCRAFGLRFARIPCWGSVPTSRSCSV